MKRIIYLVFAILPGFNAFGQWTTTNFSGERSAMGAVAYGSEVWFGGGANSTEAIDKVEIYNLVTAEWTLEHLSIPREFTAAGAAGGKILFVGGINFANFEHYSRVDIFDTQTRTWTTAELSEQKMDVAAIGYGEKVFFAGGVNLATGINSAAVDIYNATTGEWTTASLSGPGAVRAVASGSKLVFVGVAAMDIYDTATDSWTAKELPDARLFSGVVAVGNKIMIAGGMHFDNTPSDRVDIYDLSTGEWATASLSVARGFINNAATVCGKAFFAGGGTFDLNTNAWVSASDRVDIFDPATGEWTTEQLSHAVINHVVVASNNRLLVAGGVDPAKGPSVFSTVDIYACGTARVQFIHAADHETVQLVANGETLREAFAYQTATPFMNVAPGVPLNLDVIVRDPWSTHPDGRFTMRFDPGKTYIVVLQGTFDPNDAYPLALATFDKGREEGSHPDRVDLLSVRGAPDIPAPIDVVVVGGPKLADNVTYGQFGADYVSLPAGSFTLSPTPANNNDIILDPFVAHMGFWKGKSAVGFGTGFVNNGTFRPWIALSNGGTFPLYPPAGAKAQASAEKSAGSFRLTPNPASEGVEVVFDLQQAGSTALEVFDANGVQRLQVNLGDLGKGRHTFDLSVGNLPGGLYFVKSGAAVERLVVVR